VAEVVAAHQPFGRDRCREEALTGLAEVGLAGELYEAYPHELSGGQRQRVAIAQALAGRPALLLADEPTAALDSIIQAEVRGLLRGLSARRGLALLVVSHDLGALSDLTRRVYVMQSGRLIEDGLTARVFRDPEHPYTRGLLEAYPRPALAPRVVHGG
jgi:ABC-type glutathione transport system ATPase component